MASQGCSTVQPMVSSCDESGSALRFFAFVVENRVRCVRRRELAHMIATNSRVGFCVRQMCLWPDGKVRDLVDLLLHGAAKGVLL